MWSLIRYGGVGRCTGVRQSVSRVTMWSLISSVFKWSFCPLDCFEGNYVVSDRP